MKQLKTQVEVNEVQPKIKSVVYDRDEGISIFKCDGNMFFFVGVTERGDDPGDEEVGILDDGTKDIFSPERAFDLGLISKDDRVQWEIEIAEKRKAEIEQRESKEYQKYLRLKEKYEAIA